MGGLDAFVGGFNCRVRIRSRMGPGRVRGLLDRIRKAPRRTLVDELALHSVYRTGCAARGAKRFKLTTGCCARFASPVHHCPSLRVREVVGRGLHKQLGRGHVRRCSGVLPRMTGRYDSERQLTRRARHRIIGVGGTRCVHVRVKRRCRNIVSNIAG